MNIEDDILIVDDEIPNLRLLAELLEKEGYQIRPAEKAQTALDSALAKPPGLILLDVRMPEMDGFELCRRLKQDKRTQYVPIIFVSALQDLEARIQGFEAGGVDFISKPFQELEVLARVRTHMSLHRLQQHLKQLVDERTSEVAESEARFRNLMEQSPLAIVIMTPEGQITKVNTAWMRQWALEEEERAEVLARYNMRTDKQFEDLGVSPLVERAFPGESVVLPPIEYNGNRAIDEMGLEGIEARSRWIQCHLYSVKDENGGIAYVVNTNTDITDRKQVEIDLRPRLQGTLNA
jgi:two-component system cell cycle sensor histidine kinase/response regulator CckA